MDTGGSHQLHRLAGEERVMLRKNREDQAYQGGTEVGVQGEDVQGPGWRRGHQEREGMGEG